MKKTKFIILTILAVSVFYFTGCKKNYASYYEDFESVEEMEAPVMASNVLKSRKMAASTAEVFDAVMEEQSYSPEGIPSNERKLIKNGHINIEVNDLSESEKAINQWCKNLGGYISNFNNSERYANYTVQIPCAKFDEAMNSAGNFGIVKSRGISTQDVSEQYYDLQTRISSKKIMRDNLKKYLSQATKLSDILDIERELNNVLTEIESMEGRMKRLSNQIEYSTININLNLPSGKTDPVIHKPRFSDKAKAFFKIVGSFFSKTFISICYIVTCGIPLIALIAFLFWLLFGKVGLLKKLFKLLK